MKKPFNKIINLAITQSQPVSLVHFITNRCNARCSHCFIDFENVEEQNQVMSLEEIVELTKSFSSELMNVNLTGGEPFLRKDIREIVEAYFRNTSVDSVFISTHGGFTDQILSLADFVKNHFPEKKLIFSISLDHFEEDHNKNRKVLNLFSKAMKTYHALEKVGGNIMVNIGITVSAFNSDIVIPLYENLLLNGVKSVTATIVRDEGVYKTPVEEKNQIVEAYKLLTDRIRLDIKKQVIDGFNQKNYLGRMINKKNEIMNQIISKIYINNEFISPCKASSLFGVIMANGDVYPCEILKEKKIGNLFDFNLNFQDMWKSEENKRISSWISETKCRCTYECAWSYNILGNYRYYPDLLTAFFDKNYLSDLA